MYGVAVAIFIHWPRFQFSLRDIYIRTYMESHLDWKFRGTCLRAQKVGGLNSEKPSQQSRAHVYRNGN